MVNYKNGKIYKIVNDINNKFYLGSTAQLYLSTRMTTHRQKHSKCMSKNIGVDIKECSIILIENYPCKDRQELLRKEREYFDKYKKECKEVVLNKNKPIYYEGELKELRKEYRDSNKEHIKEYRDSNKEYSKEYSKKYSKEYRENNKETIKEKKKEKITCECGSSVLKAVISRHKKTKKHINLMKSLSSIK